MAETSDTKHIDQLKNIDSWSLTIDRDLSSLPKDHDTIDI